MNPVLDITLQALGLRKIAPTSFDRKLLTDELGRTMPMSAASTQVIGGAAVAWLGTSGPDLTVNGYSNHGTAYSIVKYILDVAAPLPWAAYYLDKKDNRAQVAPPAHPLAQLLYRPNPHQAWAEFKRQAQGSYQVNGECFIRRVVPAAGSRKGKTTELWCLVGRVELLPIGLLGQFDTPTGYRHFDTQTGKVMDYPVEEILHLKTWNPLYPHRGLSPIAAGIDVITAAKAGLTSRVRQYENGGMPGIIFDKSSNPEPWSAEQASGIQAWFNSFRGGGRRQGNIPISSHELGYLKLGLSVVDMDVLAAIPHDKDAIADLFHFPGQLLNGSRGTTFSNMGEAGAALYSRCVLPLESVVRDGLNRWLGPEYDDGVYLDYDTSHVPELQPSKEKLAEWLTSCYFISTQDKQRMMGVEVDESLPAYLIPMNLVPADELGTAAPAGDVAPKPGENPN